MIILFIALIGILLGNLFNEHIPPRTNDGKIGSMIVGMLSALGGYVIAQKYLIITGDFASQFLLLAVSLLTASMVLAIRSYTAHSLQW